MNIEYNLSAIDILNIFDDIPKMWETASEELSMFEEEHQIKLPDMFKKFMESANKILETADIRIKKPWFFHKEHEQKDNYLVIGRDYGAGIVYFGIRKEDLNQENPPVYHHYETDSLFDEWEELLSKHLSDYFLTVICDALTGANYDTAKETVRKYGWTYKVYSTKPQRDGIVSEYEIDPVHLPHIASFFAETDKDWISCCYDKNRNVFFLFRNTKKQKKIITISK